MASKRIGTTHDYEGNEIVELDAEFAEWMIAHEESVRKAWKYDEVWADESVPLCPIVLIVTRGIVTENLIMTGFGAKWTKHQLEDGGSWVGYEWADVQKSVPQFKFVCRRLTNAITKEVLIYQK